MFMRVVTAGIIEKDGQVLICQRPQGKRLAGVWEFPGGKLEAGETPEECLARELYEELGFEARIGEIFDARTETEFHEFLILYYWAEAASGEPKALEHAEIRFVRPEELSEYRFASSDVVVAEKIARLGRHLGRGCVLPGENA
jgi:8-oxo-dGTP diphosphatase